MNEPDGKPTLIDVFARVDKYVAIAAGIASAVTFARGSRFISYMFVIVACALLDIWLWRKATEKAEMGLIVAGGKPAQRYTHTPFQRRLLIAGMTLITLTTAAWTGFNLWRDVYLRTSLQTAITPTPTAIPDMVFIAAGSFPMGDDSDRSMSDAQPQRSVFLDAYWIDLSEVTNQQYHRFVLEGNHPPPGHWTEKNFPPGKGNHPVVNVTWHDADAYCRFVGKRLPTEAEWEKAARGSEGLIWPWGNEWGSGPANTAERKIQDTTPVGSFPEGNSPYGLADMAGNIWEWVNDWYEADYYSVAPPRNPTGPELAGISQTKVVRGGAWPDGKEVTYTFYRLGIYPPDYVYEVIGFRCACSDCR